MNRTSAARLLAVTLLGLGSTTAAVRADEPPRQLSDFVLFALDGIRSKGFTMTEGSVGVNSQNGTLFSHGPIFVPERALVADRVRINDRSECGTLFANSVTRTGDGCGPAEDVPLPLLPSAVAECGFPLPFPTCSANAAPVIVPNDTTLHLAPNSALNPSYGEVHVASRGTLVLSGEGSYRFCALRISRGATVLSQGKVNVAISGDMTLGPAAAVRPFSGAVSPADVRFHVNGRSVRIGRRADVRARVCAPAAALRITSGTNVVGTFLARTINTERMTGSLAGPGDPCLGNPCGDGLVNCGEVCDPAAPPVPCPGSSEGSFLDGSTAGAFQICNATCTRFDDSGCSAGSTTTTIPGGSTTTTTTSGGGTTTTTNPCAGSAHCGNGLLDCGEVCDPGAAPLPCESASEVGAFVDGSTGGAFRICNSTCTGFDDSQCMGSSSTTSSTIASTTSSTSTSTTTTTTSTQQGSTTTTDPCAATSPCGDGVVNCGELCDPAAPPIPCAGSTDGAFVNGGAFEICSPTCDALDDSACPVTTTSTTTSTTATTTTLPNACTSASAHCGDGVVNCGEACDPESSIQPLCGETTPNGGFVTCTADCNVDRSSCPLEICGNCIDDDGDGDVDFEDRDCCSQTQTVAMDLRRARIRATGASSSRLRLRSRLGQRPALEIDLGKQNLVLQVRAASEASFCAIIPAEQIRKKGKRKFVFRDPRNKVGSAKGLRRLTVRISKTGKIRMAAAGKNVQLKSPGAGQVRVIAGFHEVGRGSETNQCSSVLKRFTASRGGVRTR